jgi:hypothetical protein
MLLAHQKAEAMRIVRAIGAVAASTALLALGLASPALGADGDTVTTFALAGGALSVSVQPTATLTAGDSGDTTVTGSLGTVVVSDLRGGTDVWSASATSTTFTDSTGTTASTAVSYSTGAIDSTGNIDIASGSPTVLTGAPVEVAAPTSVVGNNTASWNPTLTVTLPSDSVAGDYTGTIHTSVL